jgi:DNA-binding XRE family transcriptional regulator
MENLQAYLAKTNTTQAALAAEVGISRGHMSDIVKGDKTPSLPVAAKIEKVTGGLVRAVSLIGKDASRRAQGQLNASSGGV